MKTLCRLALFLPGLLLAQPSWSGVSVQQVRGRCPACERPYQLGRFQFVTPLEGWATAFQIVVSDFHVSQSGGILHTSNGGKTWTPVPGVETYGVDVQPAFWFINARKGWMGWMTVSEPLDHLIRTANGGRRWTKLPARTPGMWVHLRFFDSNLGYAVVSTLHGPQFGITRNGGKTWVFRDDPQQAGLLYPDSMFFLNPQVGWIGGAMRQGPDLRPRLVRTVDGGGTWQEASFPPSVVGNPWDLFFLDADRGWLVLGNANPTALLRTTDGGRTWSEDVTWVAPGHSSFAHAVRYLSDRIGLVFVRGSASDDADSTSTTADTAVLVTLDAGGTWNRYELPGPVQSCEVVVREVWCTSGMNILRIQVQR